MIEPVRTSVTVNLDIEDAFRLFTTGIDSWWPVDTHSIAADDGGDVGTERVVFEEGRGGRIVEVLSTWEECPWGQVLEWDPPRQVVFDWNPSRTSRPTTEVAVTFTPENDARTRVDLQHRGWEALGPELGLEMRDAYEPGWGYVFVERFGSAIALER